MQTVVLDGFTTNPGDLSWAELEALGPCKIYDRTPAAETVARAADADILLTNKVLLTADVIARLPKLKYIGLFSTGVNVVDLAVARRRGIPVCNVPAYATPSVVQMVFGHLLHMTFHVAEHASGVSTGRWSRSIDFSYWDFPLVELAGLTMGIVGFGRIGRAVADVAAAFGMQVIAYAPRRPAQKPSNVQLVELDELFRTADVVSLHCPLNPETKGLVNAERLARMKPSAYLINTGRGPLIDEQALADALREKKIAGAGLDVLSTEPPAFDNPLLTAPNCFITPHIAWATLAARRRLLNVVVANLRAFLAGKPTNVVN